MELISVRALFKDTQAYIGKEVTVSKPREYFYSRFGLFRVRSPLLAESRLISFPRPT